MPRARLHAIILGGGTARRLGGVSKPDVNYRGRRLLDHVLDSLGEAVTGRIVVVAPETVAVPDGVARTLEEPPFGGPVAGIAAGLAQLAAAVPATLDDDLVAILTCDAPAAGRALPTLRSALTSEPSRHDCAIGRDIAGREQYLLGVYRVAALQRRIAEWGPSVLAGAPVWKFISALDIAVVDLPAELTHDIDTPEDLRHN